MERTFAFKLKKPTDGLAGGRSVLGSGSTDLPEVVLLSRRRGRRKGRRITDRSRPRYFNTNQRQRCSGDPLSPLFPLACRLRLFFPVFDIHDRISPALNYFSGDKDEWPPERNCDLASNDSHPDETAFSVI